MASTSDEEDTTVSRRPKDTKFKQQKLPAWQPVMTATNVLPFMFAIGVAFIPLGVAFLITSNNVREVMVDYTHCKSVNGSETCAQILANNTVNNTREPCICSVTFTLPTDFVAPVYVYYSLTNFYQNHRRYVKSRDDNQLLGQSMNYNNTNECDGPFKGKPYSMYAPCGAIANSLFNDTLQIFFNNSVKLQLNNTNIAWSTDRSRKFKNPVHVNGDLAGAFNDTLPPPNWRKPVYQLDVSNPNNNGYENEDLMVWMRTAALPTFRKLYRRVEAVGPFSQGLPAGNYTLLIHYNYPTVQFNGAKRMIITTLSWLGGKNPFLGIAYLVVGSLCILIGFVFLIIHLKVGKSSSNGLSPEINSQTPY